MGVAPGQIARYVFQMDADPGELYLIAVFESRETFGPTRKPGTEPAFQEFR